MTCTQSVARAARIDGGSRRLWFRVTGGNATLSIGRQADKYWSPYPARRAHPIELTLPPPGGDLRQTVSFEITSEAGREN